MERSPNQKRILHLAEKGLALRSAAGLLLASAAEGLTEMGKELEALLAAGGKCSLLGK